MTAAFRVLSLPGWLGSPPEHWQSRWERLHGHLRVDQADWDWPRAGDWMARLEDVVLAEQRPALLVAHSLGCHLAARWAAHSRHAGRVRAALLVAPPDLARDDLPPPLAGWRAVVRRRLPFRATVVYSDDDPFGSADHARALAADWGALALGAGAAGHLNAAAGLGDWPAGFALLCDLAEAAS